MKVRKTKELIKTLSSKGFECNPKTKHHQSYVLVIEGKKQHIKTYFSHGIKEYGNSLMVKVKKQLKFQETSLAEDFFDCPMTEEEYINMLKRQGDI